MTPRALNRRLSPLALAAALALGSSGLNAAPRTFNGLGSFWDVVANWTGGILPGAGDDALLGGFDSEVRTSFTINSFVGTGALTVSAGGLNFAAASSIGALNFAGGTMSGSGNLVVAGNLNWTGGGMTGAGSTTVGALTLSGLNVKDLSAGRVLNTGGTTSWTHTAANNGGLRMGTNAVVNNSGIWLDQLAFDGGISNAFGGVANFNNTGIYTKSGTGITTLGVAFNNTSSGAGTGVVNVNAGTLVLSGGGSGNGSFIGAGTLNFGGSAMTLAAGSSVNTAHSAFSGGATTLAGNYDVAGITTVNGGSANFTGNVANSGGSLVLSSGTANYSGAAPVTVSSLNMSGGSLSGTQALSVSGATIWTGGGMTGTGSTTVGTLSLSGVNVKDLTAGRVLNTTGTTTWTNTTSGTSVLRMGTGAVVNNSGSWLDQLGADSGIQNAFGGAATFNNTGSYTKNGASTTTLGVAFNNLASGAGTGVVTVDAGTLVFSAGGNGNGSFTGTGALVFSGGTMALGAGSSVNNPNVLFSGATATMGGSYDVAGTTTVSGGTANFTGSVANSGGNLVLSGGTANFSNAAGVTVSSLALSGGTLGGTQSLTVSGGSTWTAGTMVGAGTTQIGDLLLSGANVKDLHAGRVLNVSGSTTWVNTAQNNGSLRMGTSAVINNNGSWLDQQAFDGGISNAFGGSATFNNNASYTKSGPGLTTIGVVFNNNTTGAGTGVVTVNAGTLALSAGGTGNGSFTGPGTLAFSGGTMNLTAGSSVNNPNVVFSGATATLAGSYDAAGTTTVSGGSANFTGSVANSGGTLLVSGGTANFSNAAGVTVSSLALSGGTIGGTQSLTVSGPSAWTSGTMIGSGSTNVGALTLSGANVKDIHAGRVLNISGTTTWTNTAQNNGSLRMGTSAVINNNGSWLDQLAFDGGFSNVFGGSATFNNNSSYTKSGNSVTTVGVTFNNNATGVLNLDAGTLASTAGGSSAGAFNIAAGTTLDFRGGTFTLDGSVASAATGRVLVSGATVNAVGGKTFGGLLEMSSGALNVDGPATASNYLQTSGTLSGTGAVTVSGPASWTAGTMIGAGSTTFSSALTLSGTASKDIHAGRVLNANASTSWTSAALNNGNLRMGTGAVINNNGSWLDQLAFDGSISNVFGGAATFNNNGSYTKSGSGVTTVGVTLNNNATGVVNLDAGTLAATAGGSSTGSFNIASGTTLDFRSGSFALNGTVASAATGRVLVSGATVNAAGSKTFGGLLEMSSGALNVDGPTTAANYLQSGGTLGGSGALTVNGPAVWSAGTMTSTGSSTFSGALALSGANVKDMHAGRVINANGSTAWTHTAANNGSLRMGTGAVINNNGSWLDQLAFDGSISNVFGGAATFNNNGSYTKTGAGVTSISVAAANSGRITVQAGRLDLSNTLSNFAGSTLSGGTFEVIGSSTLRFAGANIVNNAATLLLDGAGSALLNSSTNANALAGFNNNTAAGSFTIRNGRNFASVGPFINAGIVNVGNASTFTAGGAFTNQVTSQLQMAGGSFAGPSLANAGVVSGFGSVTPVVSNSGTTRANGGTLTLAGGVLGATGTVLVDSGATLALGAGSTAGTLNHNGTLLALGANNITVFADYDSANFGVGNSFDRRGGVSGAGQILASGTAQQTLSGAQLTGGNTANATLVLPTIRVGQGGIGSSFSINNVGLGGPALRGALVTTGISNAGLSGSGVTAQNWGAVTQFGAGQNFSINFDPSVGQALSGQVLQVVNNFDNVAGQTLAITGEAFNLASASAATPSPVVFANQRVGGTLSQALTLTNTAPNSGFSESLNAGISAGGTATAGGSFALLAAGSSSSALFVGVDTSTAGAKSGTATITLVSDGTGTSGFAPLGIGTQTVDVSGNVYRLAQASTVNPNVVLLGNQREGGTLTQALTLANVAAADGFSERLNASISGSVGIITGGSFTQLAAGGSSNSLFVGVDASTAGNKSGTATIALASDGTGTSGLPLFGLGTQVVNVSATVYRLASASAAAPSPVALVNQRVGGTLTQALSITNTAATDSFSEGLSASIAAGGTATVGGSFSVLAAGATSNALFVGVDTSSAGTKGGTATITLSSDGSGSSGFGSLALGTQNVAVSGNVYRLAGASLAAPNNVILADQRVGGSLTGSVAITNTAAADGFSESLNALISASGGAATATGSFSLLAAGATNNSALAVGVDTTTAGAKIGTALITLASDGSGTSGFAALDIGTQNLSVSGNVFRLALPVVDTTPLTMVARVGDAALSRNIAVSNNAPDLYTERLNASVAGTPAGIGSGPALVGLMPNASGNLVVTLGTGTAGSFGGPAVVSLVSSSAGTSSGAADFALGSVNVPVTGRVYAPAVAQVATTTVNFGTVRVGDVLAARSIAVGNGASGALTDTLQATLSGGDATFGVAGTVSGLAAGASNNTALAVQMSTASAGVFSANATLALNSQNPELADLALSPVNIGLQGQVNNLANAALAQASGGGTFSGTAFSYTLDFGTLQLGSGAVGSTLTLANAVGGPADALAGNWDLSGLLAGSGFTVGGFGSFTGLAAGNTLGGLSISFDSANEGNFNGVLVLDGLSTNGSGPNLALPQLTLQLHGSVVAVPEPGSWGMMFFGLLAVGSIARRRLQAQAA